MDYLVGIDLGSTSLKAVVYDLKGNAVAKASRPTERFNPDPAHPDWAIWKPEQIWGGACEALKEAVAKLDKSAAIRGVAVTGMGMDGVPMTRDGQWLYPFISWHCARTKPQQDWWLEHVGAEKQFSISGNPVWAINSALRILWMREHEPEILEKTHKWLLIEDFVNFMLCGEFATDYSMASNTLLLDQRTRTYSEELLEISGIDGGLLAGPRPSGTTLGEVHARAAEATGLPKGTPVVLGGHDFLCGALPAGAFKPGVVLSVLGTWDIIVAAIPEPVLTTEACKMGTWVDSHVARDMWAVMGSAVAAEMLEWFRDQFGAEEKRKAEAEGGVDWDYLMAAAAASPPGAHGAVFLPHMSGSSFPIVDAASSGAFVGLRNIVTKGDMVRAVVEGLSYQFFQILKGLESGFGLKAESLVAVGGGTKNRFAMQNKADMAGKPIETPEIDEATPLGAAILAGIGVGLYRDEQDAYDHVARPGRVYEPDPKLTARYAEWYTTFEQLYPALKGIHARLRAQA
ncbi:MAG TPA: FGGY family carbohydrate kinase [Planctomycetota bacterium]|nr:FGGY family carbohydrate kinase [Planctomycetota bacterium]